MVSGLLVGAWGEHGCQCHRLEIIQLPKNWRSELHFFSLTSYSYRPTRRKSQRSVRWPHRVFKITFQTSFPYKIIYHCSRLVNRPSWRRYCISWSQADSPILTVNCLRYLMCTEGVQHSALHLPYFDIGNNGCLMAGYTYSLKTAVTDRFNTTW